jgi:outer membrane receptor protein involved in Fe transport
LNNQLSVFGNWGQSNRAPTVIELGCADPAQPCQLPTGLQADPPLKQVVSQTIEGGMRWKNSNNYNLSVSAYQTTNKDDILFLASQTSGAGYFNNFDQTQYRGMDVQVSKTWGAWRLNTTYSYLKATYEASASLPDGDRVMAITPGMRLPGIPEHNLKVHLNWQATEQWSWGASWIHTSSIVSQGNEDGILAKDSGQHEIVGNANVKGYNLLHLKTNYQVQKDLELFGKINNVLDTRYESYGLLHQNNFNPDGSLLNGNDPTLAKFIAPGAPRTYMVGLRFKF